MPRIAEPTKKRVPFIEILKLAARIIWQNRFLFWFGLLMALGSPGSFNIGNNENWDKEGSAAKSFLEAHWQIALTVALILIIIGIILFLISLVAKASLIKSVNLIAKDKKATFKEGWKSGKKYLGKLFGIFVLFFLAFLMVIIVLTIPVLYLAAAKSWAGAIIVGLLAVAIFIPLAFIFTLTKTFAEFYVVLSNLKVRSAIETGYDLLLKNVGNSIIFALLIFAVGVLASLVLLPVAAVALIILVPAGLLFYYLNKIAFAIFLAFAVALFLAAILAVSAVFQTYKTTAWTLFFREIAKVEKPEAEKVAEEEVEKSIAATPEGA